MCSIVWRIRNLRTPVRLRLWLWALAPGLALALAMGEPGAASGRPAPVAGSNPGFSSLREKFQGQFLMGVAVDGNPAKDYSPAERHAICEQFGAIIPANCLKMTAVQRAEGQFDFRLADAFVGFALTNGLKACGHCLVWAKDERTPEWIF